MNNDAYVQNLLGEIAAQRDAALNQLATANARARTLEQELAELRAGNQPNEPVPAPQAAA